MKRTLSFLVTLCLVASFFAATPAYAHHDDDDFRTERVTFHVTLSNNQTYTLVGYLYSDGNPKHRPLQVLLNGASYNHLYWDIPEINNHDYSYARFMAEEGYAVLALDQLGTGESDRPDGDFLTVAEAASSVHQVVTALRTKQNPLHHAFKKIALVGHSLGSILAIYTESTFGRSADALVVTSLSVTPGASTIPPALFDALLAAPYVTFPPETRIGLGYYLPSVDPDVITYDSTHLADGISRGMVRDFPSFLTNPSWVNANSVTEPVLIQLGEFDAAFPPANCPDEAANYSSAASATLQILPNIGHTFNVHLNHEFGWEQIAEWLEDTL
jgi:pimeloyl-ACP methyl ester carboxylesterase